MLVLVLLVVVVLLLWFVVLLLWLIVGVRVVLLLVLILLQLVILLGLVITRGVEVELVEHVVWLLWLVEEWVELLVGSLHLLGLFQMVKGVLAVTLRINHDCALVG